MLCDDDKGTLQRVSTNYYNVRGLRYVILSEACSVRSVRLSSPSKPPYRTHREDVWYRDQTLHSSVVSLSQNDIYAEFFRAFNA